MFCSSLFASLETAVVTSLPASPRPVLLLSPLRPVFEPELDTDRRTEIDQMLALASGKSFHE
jgi:hypothetical protein